MILVRIHISIFENILFATTNKMDKFPDDIDADKIGNSVKIASFTSLCRKEITEKIRKGPFPVRYSFTWENICSDSEIVSIAKTLKKELETRKFKAEVIENVQHSHLEDLLCSVEIVIQMPK